MTPSLDEHTGLGGSSRLDDWQLLSAYTRGDEAAFESLVKHYFGLVYGVALRQVRDSYLAEEAAQSTFITLARKAGKLSSQVPLCGWLLRTVRFVCKDALKMQRRRLQLEQAFETHLDQQSESEMESADVVLLEEALLALAPGEQACVLARFFEGRTFKEVGELLGIGEEAAQKKLTRCLKKMRRYLSRRGARTTDAAMPGLLGALFAPPPVPETLIRAALTVIQAAGKGKLAVGTTLVLAERCLRLLTRRGWAQVAAKVALPLLVLTLGGWASWSLSHPSNPAGFKPSAPRAETLGKDWSRVVLRAALAKHKYTSVPAPNDPEFQVYAADLKFILDETTRITGQFYAGLGAEQERQVLAEFLTVEMRETLQLDATQQAALLAFIRDRLSQGRTLKDSEKAMAQSTRVEADRIKTRLSRSQQRLFDRVYGADGMCLFQFVQLAAAKG